MADVVELISNDHREVERLFDQINADPDQRAILVPQVCSLLFAHSTAERIEVYPFVVDELDETEQIERAEDEHDEVEGLVGQLETLDPDSEDAADTLRQLEEIVRAHNREEETTILARMVSDLDSDRRHELGEAFAATREAQMT